MVVVTDARTGQTYIEGELHLVQHDGRWFVEYFDGHGIHRVGPTTKAKAKLIIHEARTAMGDGDKRH